jgi:hypothetical protein
MGKRLTRPTLSEAFRKVPDKLQDHLADIGARHGDFCVVEVQVDSSSDPAIRLTGECVSANVLWGDGTFATLMVGVDFVSDPSITAAVKERAVWGLIAPLALPVLGPGQPQCIIVGGLATDQDNTITAMKKNMAARMEDSALVLRGDPDLYRLPDVQGRAPGSDICGITDGEQEILTAMVQNRWGDRPRVVPALGAPKPRAFDPEEWADGIIIAKGKPFCTSDACHCGALAWGHAEGLWVSCPTEEYQQRASDAFLEATLVKRLTPAGLNDILVREWHSVQAKVSDRRGYVRVTEGRDKFAMPL